MIEKIKAVIFDMDGLMVDSERLGHEGWQKAGKEFGYTISDAAYFQVTGRTIRDAEIVFKKIFGDDFPFWEIRDQRVKMEYQYYDEFGIPLKPGLLELLTLLESKSIPKAVATSSGHKAADFKLVTANLKERFNAVVSGDQVENGKPAPDIFLRAANLLNISPGDCLVLEDSEAGVKSAHAAGMTPIMVPDLKPPSKEIRQIAFHVADSLHDVRELLAKAL